MIYYLTKFTRHKSRSKHNGFIYLNKTWWGARSKTRAEAFLKHVAETYGVRGRLIKVKELK